MSEPLFGPETLQLMQSQHQAILAAVRDGSAREAEVNTRAHIQYIRDSISEALSSEGNTP